MFKIIKSIIWIVGFIVVCGFALDFFGYEINWNSFQESKAECLKRLDDCKSEYIRQGTENAQCDFDCVDTKLIIRKKE